MINNFELLAPFVMVAYTMWATPGPNNMMLTYSGARFGFAATMPHILGIICGTFLLNLFAILGLKPLIDQWPIILLVLKIIGSIWLMIIGWKMATATNSKNNVQEEKPMRFYAALLFQFANPKAIVATLALVSFILIAIDANQALLWWVLLIIPFLAFLAITPWVVAGQTIRRFLSSESRWKMFTYTTGLLTAGCAIFLWI